MERATEPACDVKTCEFHKMCIDPDRSSFAVCQITGSLSLDYEIVRRHHFAIDGVIYNICDKHTHLPEAEIAALLLA